VSPVPGRIQSIERAAAILRLLSGATRLHGVGELAGELGLSKSTVHGLLRTLQHVGFAEQDRASGKYRLGAALLHMGSSYLDGSELRNRALNWADALASRSDESVRIGTLHDGRVLVGHHVFRPDDTRQALDAGTLMPAHASALGKVLLAARDYLYEELVDGVVSIAAPIQDVQGVVVGAVGISGPVERLCDGAGASSRHVSYVPEAGRSISRELGAIPWWRWA